MPENEPLTPEQMSPAGRIAFGFFAVLLGLCAAYAWWRWLRSVFGSGDDEGDAGSG